MRIKKTLLLALVGAFLVALTLVGTTRADGPQWVVVNPGDTLFAIAARYGTSLQALMQANNLPNANFVYSGQRLLIPDASLALTAPENPSAPGVPASPSAPAQSEGNAVYYTVSPGDSLTSIATRFGVSATAIAEANGLSNSNFVWYGQRLRIPGTTSVTGVNPPPAPEAPTPFVVAADVQGVKPSVVAADVQGVKPILAASSAQVVPVPNEQYAVANPPLTITPPTDGKWISVDVTKQTTTAYIGSTPIKTILSSTGTAYHPTVIGTFHIQSKYASVEMIGGTPGVDYYDLPGVPWTMFFYEGYALHGTYWHHNFGHPMSHGCVNLPTDEAKWFYDWASIGTPVVAHL